MYKALRKDNQDVELGYTQCTLGYIKRQLKKKEFTMQAITRTYVMQSGKTRHMVKIWHCEF